MKTFAMLVLALLAPVATAAPALAHAERSASTPREGAAVAAPPRELRITFTEPPSSDAVVEVTDGCGRDVVAGFDVENFELTAELREGQPGKWRVHTNVLSLVDGHNTRDLWTFDVRGKADCTAQETVPPEPGDEEDEEGGSGIVPLLGLGAAVVVLTGIALAVRGRSG